MRKSASARCLFSFRFFWNWRKCYEHIGFGLIIILKGGNDEDEGGSSGNANRRRVLTTEAVTAMLFSVMTSITWKINWVKRETRHLSRFLSAPVRNLLHENLLHFPDIRRSTGNCCSHPWQQQRLPHPRFSGSSARGRGSLVLSHLGDMEVGEDFLRCCHTWNKQNQPSFS